MLKPGREPGWQPEIPADAPRYLALADAIARDIAEGRLRPGERLPTHRELARALGVTVGTVSRGFAEAERRGLTVGEVGRGTFVRAPAAETTWLQEPQPEGALIDFNHSLPVSLPEEAGLLAATMEEIAAEPPRVAQLLRYRSDSATPRQRRVAADWLSRLGLPVGAEQLLVTAGSQHGLHVVLASLFRPGQVLLTGKLTYPAIKSQARSFGLRLRGVELDEEGICPEALERACASDPKPAALYVVPTLQNPTAAMMSQDRRRQIAEICERHDLWIIEDDIHAHLPGTPVAPIAAGDGEGSERVIYLASVSKCISPGLRTGFIVAPESVHGRLLGGIHSTLWMAPPLMVELTTRWLEDGTADRLIAAKRRETAARQALARRILDGHAVRSHDAAYHLWIELPDPLCSDELVAAARQRGVLVAGAGAFAVGRSEVPHAFRVSIGVAPRPDLERGLHILAELLDGGASPAY